MKVQDLRGLEPGDTFKVAGVTLTVTGPNVCARATGKRYFWGAGAGAGATDLHDMEVTDVVRKRERVTIGFEILRDEDECIAGDAGVKGGTITSIFTSPARTSVGEMKLEYGYEKILREVRHAP